MLKLAGASLILGAAIIYGYQLKSGLLEHVSQLIGLKEMLLILKGQIAYARTPLREAFTYLADQGTEPYQTLFQALARQMGAGDGRSMQQIWRFVLAQEEQRFLLKPDEMIILRGVGENLGFLDADSQLSNLELHIQQTEVKIVQAQKELGTKQKVYQYLSVMSGIFLILILI